MKDNIDSGAAIELNEMFSTTRRVFKSDVPEVRKPVGIAEGGLRTHGFSKCSAPGKPLISVVTVVYNGEQHIEKAIQSVIRPVI